MTQLTRRQFLAGVSVSLWPSSLTAGEGGLIAAAASLRVAMPSLLELFEAETGRRVRVSFGSSGTLFRKIMNGAPFDLFLSADEQYVERLADAGRSEGRGTVYAVGRLALVARQDSPLRVDTNFTGLRKALAENAIARFAIANPEHAPYGLRAKEALRHAGLWEALEPRLVLGENTTQAAQFALSGAVDGGIIARALATSKDAESRLRSADVPAGWHAPIRQRMVLMPGAASDARAFRDFLTSARAASVLAAHGFDRPGRGA